MQNRSEIKTIQLELKKKTIPQDCAYLWQGRVHHLEDNLVAYLHKDTLGSLSRVGKSRLFK